MIFRSEHGVLNNTDNHDHIFTPDQIRVRCPRGSLYHTNDMACCWCKYLSGRVARRCTVSGSWDAFLWCNGVNLGPTSWTAWWKISYPIQLGEGGLGASPSLHRQNLAAVLVGWRGVNSERSPRRGCRSTWSSTALPPRKRQSLECSMSSCPGVGLGSPCL